MLEIGIFAPFGTDHDRNIAFCQDTDVRHIVLSAAVLAAPEGAGVPDAADLHALVGTYAGEGVALTALIPPRISLDALTDHEAREREIGLVRGIVQAMGQAGVPFLHLYLSSDPVPDDQEARSRLWAGLVDIYRDLCAAAEGAGVRIATHHYHLPDRLVWNCESMTALLDE
ncbi:MAG: hypothetical protein QGI83_15330, partial [Candidatus Latescibacteria bacterium]|nr:hypothetical protein [Candidatus Latescibacterota bacterium]